MASSVRWPDRQTETNAPATTSHAVQNETKDQAGVATTPKTVVDSTTSKSIAEQESACLKAFDTVIRSCQSIDVDEVGNITAEDWEDELGRFRIWTSDIRMHSQSSSSLDYRLRDDAEIRKQVVLLLQELQGLLEDAQNTPQTSSDVSMNPPQSIFWESDMTEAQELHAFVSDSIRGLFRLTMLVRSPPKNDFIRSHSVEDLAAAIPAEKNNILKMEPSVDTIYGYRLARAMIIRWQYFNYRRRRQEVGQGPEPAGDSTSDALQTSEAPSIGLKQGEALTSPASLIVPTTSSNASLLSDDRPFMPKRPKVSAKGASFECPFCLYDITASSRRTWVRHLFDDLRPYVCHITSCQTPDRLWHSRHEWSWHIRMTHPDEWRGRSDNSSLAVCPICQFQYEVADWDRHVARHLQELCLPALPQVDKDCFGDIAESDDSEVEHDPIEMIGLPEILPREQSRGLPQPLHISHFEGPPLPKHYDSIRYLLMEYGTDWSLIARYCVCSPTLARKWFKNQVRKGRYGDQLNHAAELANRRAGRPPERFTEGRWPFPCPDPECEGAFGSRSEFEYHIMGKRMRHGEFYNCYCLYQDGTYIYSTDGKDFTAPTVYTGPKISQSETVEAMSARFDLVSAQVTGDYDNSVSASAQGRHHSLTKIATKTYPRLRRKLLALEQWDDAGINKGRLDLLHRLSLSRNDLLRTLQPRKYVSSKTGKTERVTESGVDLSILIHDTAEEMGITKTTSR